MLLAVVGRAGEEDPVERYLRVSDRAHDLLDAGDYAAADHVFEEAVVASVEGRLTPNTLVAALRGRITCRYKLFDLVGARDQTERLLAVQEQMPDEEALAITLADLGYLEVMLGNATDAIPLLQEAGDRLEALKEGSLLARVRARVALAYTDLGQYARALEAGEESELALLEGEDLDSRYEVLTTLGLLYIRLGWAEDALRLFDDEAATAFGLESAIWRGSVLANRATSLATLGRTRRALEELANARAVFERADFREGYASTFVTSGAIRLERQEHAEALTDFQRARELAPERPVAAATALLGIGLAQVGLEDYEKARENLNAALRAARDLGSVDLESWCEGALAELELACDRPDEAIGHAERALDAIDVAIAGLSPMTEAMVRGTVEEVVATLLEASFRTGSPARVLRALERTRAAVLVSSLGGAGVLRPPDLPPEVRDAIRSARERIGEAQALYRQARERGTGKLDELRPFLTRLRDAQGAWRRAVASAQRSQERDVLGRSLRLASETEVQASLAAGDALVLYAIAGERLRALVFRGGEEPAKPPAVVDVADAEEVRDEVEAFCAQCRDRESEPDLAGMRRLLVEPLGLGEGVKRLVVSPGGVLARVPFATLAAEPTIVFVPSATAHVLLAKRPATRGEKILAVGDPNYRRERAGRALEVYAGGEALEPLPLSRDEVLSITREGDKWLLGDGATEEAVTAALGTRDRWRAVHLACHGLLDRRRPEWTSLALTPGAQDGFLTVLEVYGLRVPADLVTLSACDTGLGREVPGEGILGLTGAFMHAGAPRVVASLWKVETKATNALMKEFYRLWHPPDGSEGISAAEALKAAQAEVRKDERFAHPRYWAAWVLWGRAD